MAIAMLASGLQKEFDSSFGNYLLHGIEEVYLPLEISWWPQTLAWKLLAVVSVVLLCRFLIRFYARWRNNLYRRQALASLDRIEQDSKKTVGALVALPELLKATALKAYPRGQVAGLSGRHWLRMLDSKWNKTAFDSSLGEHLLRITYQPISDWQSESKQSAALIELSRQWISSHQPIIKEGTYV